MSGYRAFTIKANGLLRALCLEVGVTAPTDRPEGLPPERVPQYSARIDTGIDRSRVSSRIVRELGLARGEVGGRLLYRADIYFPNRIRFSGVPVDETDDLGAVDCVVGMDILSCGDCAISNKDRQTVFSFRAPATEHIDFVKDHQAAKAAEAGGRVGAPADAPAATRKAAPAAAKPPAKRSIAAATRNQLCPCGSGKKHKNCCGKLH